MRRHLTHKTIPWAFAAALLLAAGCGDDNDTSEDDNTETGAATETAAGDSEYCEAAVEWAIHEMQPFDDSDPEAVRAYWQEYGAFEEEALATAPEDIKADWELKVAAEDETIDPVLERYGYDINAIMEQGSPEEQATFEAPPDAAAAQDAILTYESEVCGSQQPVAADVSYDGEEPGPYCEIAAAQDDAAGAALASGDPAEVEAVLDELEAQSTETTEAAPDVIKDDVAALVAWTTGPQRDVIEEFGFDLEAVMRDGTVEDRLTLNQADEEIREQFARVIAYEEQVCGA